MWIYSDWYDSEQNYQRRKAKSIEDRINDEVLQRNIKTVAKYYMEFSGMDNKNIAESKAYALLKGNKMASIRMLGVPFDKLITRKEQL